MIEWSSSYTPVEKIVDAFDGAKYVQYNEFTDLFYVWNGSLTINIYDSTLKAVDIVTLGEQLPDTDAVHYAVCDLQDTIARHNDYIMENYDEA